MDLNKFSVATLALAASIALTAAIAARADTAPAHVTQVAKLPDTAQADASVATRHLVAAPPLLWPVGESPEREAKVTLRYTIEPDGHVDHIEVLGGNPHGVFADAAVNAVCNRLYAPAPSATAGAETVVEFHAAP